MRAIRGFVANTCGLVMALAAVPFMFLGGALFLIGCVLLGVARYLYGVAETLVKTQTPATPASNSSTTLDTSGRCSPDVAEDGQVRTAGRLPAAPAPTTFEVPRPRGLLWFDWDTKHRPFCDNKSKECCYPHCLCVVGALRQ